MFSARHESPAKPDRTRDDSSSRFRNYAESMGINLAKTKTLAFALSAALTGLAGRYLPID